MIKESLSSRLLGASQRLYGGYYEPRDIEARVLADLLYEAHEALKGCDAEKLLSAQDALLAQGRELATTRREALEARARLLELKSHLRTLAGG